MVEQAVRRRGGGWKHFISPLTQSIHFKYLWLGQVLSIFGSSITSILLPVIVLSLTHSTVAMGIVMTVYSLPNVIILPFAGVIVDKLHRVKLMMLVDLFRFILLLSVAALIFNHQLSINALYILVGMLGLMNGIFNPAYSAVRAKVFTPDIRNAANSLTQIAFQSVRILGPSIGGIMIASFSSGYGLSIDGLTYLISFISLTFLRNLTFKKHTAHDNAVTASFKNSLLEGFNIIKKNAWLLYTIIAFSLINICASGIIGILVPWLIYVHYHLSATVFGVVMSGAGAGAVLGALLFGMRNTWHKRAWIAYGSVILASLTLFLMAFTSSPAGLFLCMIVEGACTMLFGLIWETSLQELVPEESFGRVASLDMLGSFALLPLGYLFTGWLSEAIGGIQTIIIFSLVPIVIAIGVLSISGVRKFD